MRMLGLHAKLKDEQQFLGQQSLSASLVAMPAARSIARSWCSHATILAQRLWKWSGTPHAALT